MKILMITPYVTIEGRTEFERNKTGFGYMVMDIAKAVGKIEYVDVLATDTRGDRFEYGGVTFIKRSLIAYLLGLFSSLPLGALFSLRNRYSMNNGTFVRLTYYWLMTGYLHKLLKKEKYDVVHIHGCSFATELWMNVCKECNQKYMVTLHGLNSFSDTVTLDMAGKQYERDFLRRVSEGKFPISVISTGMKKLIEKTFAVDNCDNIKVVCNSFTFSGYRERTENIRAKYSIPKGCKILLCVGNITTNKNQIQLVRAYGLLPNDIQNNTYVLFCGRPNPSCGVEAEIAKQKHADHLIVCGGIEKAKLSSYYAEAYGVALLSIAEGFGLSLIEGMHFGKPCVTFEDLPAYEDIFDSCAVVGIPVRDDKEVSRAIEKCLTRVWDENAIKVFSNRFNSEHMAINYINAYKSFLC